jgi:hypothetical protein
MMLMLEKRLGAAHPENLAADRRDDDRRRRHYHHLRHR